jgi:thiamine biosynthesis lipoprotein
MNRREFLRPRRLAQAAGNVVGAVEELQALVAEPEPEVAQEMSLLTFSRQAMATTFEVLVPFGIDHALDAANEALDEIDRLEAQLTVYRDDSEVSRLNQCTATEAVTVETNLFRLLCLAQQIHRDTEGAFDITAGALIKTWGFFRRAGQVPNDADRRQALQRTGMHRVLLDAEKQTVRYLRPGLEINLGSIGKGHALDRAADLMRRHWNIPCALLHGGKSSVYALGSPPGTSRGWPVALRHPWEAERPLGVVRLRHRGLATSAATFQHLEHNGKKLGHLLDPRTGWPADGIASATVLAPTAAEADALATAFFILGVEKARAYCASHPQVGAVLLPSEENARPVVLGLSPEEIVLSPGITAPNPQQ